MTKGLDLEGNLSVLEVPKSMDRKSHRKVEGNPTYKNGMAMNISNKIGITNLCLQQIKEVYQIQNDVSAKSKNNKMYRIAKQKQIASLDR